MFRIKTKVTVGPGSIAGEDVIPLVPRLRFSSYRKEQLKAYEDKQHTNTSNLVRGKSSWGLKIHADSELIFMDRAGEDTRSM